MKKLTYGVDFYLGANTPLGFVSLYPELYGPKDKKAVIIKGGPGTGKSTIMKNVGDTLNKKGYDTQYIHCSFDPYSLDAVIFPGLNACVTDGTSPHIVEPVWPGVVEELVNFGAYWNTDKILAKKEEIIEMITLKSKMFKNAYHLLTAAGDLHQCNQNIRNQYLITSKIKKFAHNLVSREFKPAGKEYGTEKKRFLSGITPEGIITFYSTAESLCPKLYVLEDKHSIGSSVLNELRILILQKGYDIISCNCCMDPHNKLEHLLIPDAKIGFITSNSWHKYQGIAYRNINTERFIDKPALKKDRQKLTFNKKVSRELLNETISQLGKIKALHQKLEGYYISAMDFNALSEMKEIIVNKLES